MNVVVAVVLFVLAAWFTLGVFFGITLVGKPRKPITPGGAARTTFVGVVLVVVMVVAALRLLA